MSDPIAFALNAQPQQFAAAAASKASYNSNQHEIQLNYEEIADLFENEQINNNDNSMNNVDAAPILQMQPMQHHIISDESGSGSSDSEDSFAFDSGLARPIGKKSSHTASAAPAKKVVPVSAARPLKKRGRRLSELVPREVTVSTTSAYGNHDEENSRRISITSQQSQEPVSPLATPNTMQMPMQQQPMQMQQPNILTHQVYFQQRLNALMRQSQASLKALQDYDKSQGLPASHCATMVKSYRSRKQLLTGKILKKWDGTPLISFQTNADGSVTVHSGDKKERKKVVKKSSGKTSAAATN